MPYNARLAREPMPPYQRHGQGQTRPGGVSGTSRGARMPHTWPDGTEHAVDPATYRCSCGERVMSDTSLTFDLLGAKPEDGMKFWHTPYGWRVTTGKATELHYVTPSTAVPAPRVV